MIDFEIETELNSCLGNDEKFIWTGKPKTGIVFRSSDVFLIPFSLLWGGVPFFLIMTVLFSNGPFIGPFIFGILIVLIWLYVVVGRFFLDAKKRENTCYGITQDRIIIKSGIFSKEFKSLNIKTLSAISLNQFKDKSGTITLGTTYFHYSLMQGLEWTGIKQPPPRLEFIQDVEKVYDIIMITYLQSNR